MKKKRILLAFAFFVIALSAIAQSSFDPAVARDLLAQNTNKFLTVKGVELRPGMGMKTLLNLFLEKGWQKHDLFDIIEQTNGVYVLNGTFFSERNCNIKIIPTSYNKDVVGIVGISFPDRTSFKDLKSEYDRLKSALSDKYHLALCTEKFDDDYIENSSSDYLKLKALSNDEATFQSRFYISENASSLLLGQIILNINAIKVDYDVTYNVSVSYCTSDNIVEQLGEGKDDL